MSDTTPEKKPRVQSAARAVELLQTVARAESSGIAAGAISAQLGVPRQVVYHLAHTLIEMNMLRKVGRGSYILGPGIGTIAQGFRRQVGSSDMALEFATKAAALTGETAYVVGWLEDEIIVLGTAKGSGAIQAAEVPQGTAGDAHARASGKLLLAMANEQDKTRYLEAHTFTRRTKNTIASRSALERELSKVRENWFACEREEYELGLSCMAVPLGNVPSMLVLGISAPTFRFDENWQKYLEILREVADEAS
ncbi:MAG: IclR family transcriptional regulator [Betaproteobacteria bacterium]